MSTQRVMIYASETDLAARQAISTGVTQVLAEYPNAILAEVTGAQAQALRDQGFEVADYAAQAIKLRSVEIDTSQAAPPAPAAVAVPGEIGGPEPDYWILQFVGPAKSEWTEQLRGLGVRFDDYVPENAFLVQMRAAVRDQVAALPFVNWVGPYESSYKLSPILLGRRVTPNAAELPALAIDAAANAPAPQGNIRVLLHQADDSATVDGAVTDLGGEVVSISHDMLVVSLAPEQINQLAQVPEVKWIEPIGVRRLHNDVAAGIMGVQPAWDHHGLDGEGQIVAVADTGLDTGVDDASMHADFRGRVVAIHDRSGDGPADRCSGHGTHVAGSVLGNGAQSGGAIRGMAPAARLAFIAVANNADQLVGIPNDLNLLFQQAYDDGARIQSNSWGSTETLSGTSLEGQYMADTEDVDQFTWNHKDMVILYSTANTGRDPNPGADGIINEGSVSVEATAKNCISVGASENNRGTGGAQNTYSHYWPTDFPVNPLHDDHMSDNSEGMAAFSSRGPCDDGRLKPDVVAPGTNILSVRSSLATENGWGLLPAGDPRRPYYFYMGGTSMSTPLTAGAVALIREYLVRAYLIPNPPSALIKALLVHGATGMAGQYAAPHADISGLPDNNQGWGRVNINNTLFPVYPTRLEFRADAAHAVGTGEQREYTFQVVDTSVPFRATLVWTDYPSTPTSGGNLVNTLRLAVVRPDGTSTQGTPGNNNVQQVAIATPAPGQYRVRVTGVTVPTQATSGQRQDFAVVATGGLNFAELYIKDNATDEGIAPSLGAMCLSPDISITLSNDPAAPPVPNPEHGQTNYVLVKVHNRGPRAANGATVKLYWANPGTNLSRPYWNTSDIKVNGVTSNAVSIDVPGRTAAGEGEAIATFEWRPPDPAINTHDAGHFCLFATVDHPDDPLMMEDVDLVRWEDNLAWKNLIVQDVLPDTLTWMEFYLAGRQRMPINAGLHINACGLPGATVTLNIPARYLKTGKAAGLRRMGNPEGGQIARVQVVENVADLQGFAMRAGENTRVRVEVKIPGGVKPGQTYPIFVEQRVDGTATGRVTLLVHVVEDPAYIGNPASGHIHAAGCRRIGKAAIRVPYDDLKLALKRGYKPCGFCLRDMHG